MKDIKHEMKTCHFIGFKNLCTDCFKVRYTDIKLLHGLRKLKKCVFDCTLVKKPQVQQFSNSTLMSKITDF